MVGTLDHLAALESLPDAARVVYGATEDQFVEGVQNLTLDFDSKLFLASEGSFKEAYRIREGG